MSSKPVQRLDHVVIRFAGDSGDGMQLTGDRFTSETAALGNDLSTLPNFPAEIRAPQGTLPGVSSFQLHFADHDVLTPGDAPDVLVAMNPAALKANLRDIPRGATIIVNTDEFTKRNLAKVGYATSPVDDDTLDELPRAPGRADLDHGGGARRVRPVPQGQGAREEHVRARPAVVALHPPDARHRAVPEEQVRRPARDPRGQPRRAARRLQLRRDHRGLRGHLRDRPGPDAGRHLPQHHRQRRAVLRPGRGDPPRGRCRSCWGPTRSPRPPTSCTRSRRSSASA